MHSVLPAPRRRDPLAVRRVVTGLLSWALFALAWLVVLARSGGAVPVAVVVLPVSVAVVLLVTTVWIRHNRRIYRRKGPRRGTPAVTATPVEDRLGRPLLFGTPDLSTAGEVVVDVVDGRKTYRVGA